MGKRLTIIGGGAAGFFAAINAAEMHPDLEVAILEKSAHVLQKVKVSGGGRCNVTHACFEPKELIKFYPRGSRELLGPFHKFQPGDTIDWFERRGVSLKIESDGRMFPDTDSSQTIIDCFMKEAQRLGVRIKLSSGVKSFEKTEEGWVLNMLQGENITTDYLLIATGSSPAVWSSIAQLGHTIVEPVPSLFTFNIKDQRIHDLPGIASTLSEVKIEGTKFSAQGPVLITHWGLSGPGILRLSAWAARELADCQYDFIIRVNWDVRFTRESMIDYLKEWKQEHSKTQVKTYSAIRIPLRLWQSLIASMGKLGDLKWAEVNHKQIDQLSELLCQCYFKVQGKSTFKDEFVTAGGVSLKEIDFRTMESKLLPGLFFAGEVMDIDAITGGFNFQAAWTTAYLTAMFDF